MRHFGVVGAGQARDRVEQDDHVAGRTRPCRLAFSMTISATCTCRLAGSSKVELMTSALVARSISVTSSGPLVDQQDDDVRLGVVRA